MVDIHLSSLTYGPIQFEQRLRDDPHDEAFYGGRVFIADGAFGQILVRDIPAGEIECYYIIFQLKEDLALDFEFASEIIQMQIAWKNDFQFHANSLGEIYLAEGQYNFSGTASMNGTVYFEKEYEYHFLSIRVKGQLGNKFTGLFSALQKWIATETTSPGLLYKPNRWLSEPMREVIEHILQGQELEDADQRAFYREIKISELLYLAFNDPSINPDQSLKLSRRNTQLIYESKQFLDSNYNQHITVSLIARQVGLNDSRLKAGFRQLFGISIFDYLVMTRMQVARSLLLETDKPLKEIASLTGYATKQSFINAFKKYFKETPGAYRREY